MRIAWPAWRFRLSPAAAGLCFLRRRRITIPLSAFSCGGQTGSGGITTAADQLNRIELASTLSSGDERFCVGKLYVA